jgi:prepilin-type N-terminal cleavage/methylation domain-containing protein
MPSARLHTARRVLKPVGRRAAGCRGFSLIEICIATLIIGIGVAALLMTMAAGTKVNGASQDRTQASFLCQELREWTVQMPFANLPAMNNVTYSPPRDGQGNPITSLAGWSQTITMTGRDPTNLASPVAVGSTDMIYVQVAVSHQNHNVLTTGWLVSKGST